MNSQMQEPVSFDLNARYQHSDPRQMSFDGCMNQLQRLIDMYLIAAECTPQFSSKGEGFPAAFVNGHLKIQRILNDVRQYGSPTEDKLEPTPVPQPEVLPTLTTPVKSAAAPQFPELNGAGETTAELLARASSEMPEQFLTDVFSDGNWLGDSKIKATITEIAGKSEENDISWIGLDDEVETSRAAVITRIIRCLLVIIRQMQPFNSAEDFITASLSSSPSSIQGQYCLVKVAFEGFAECLVRLRDAQNLHGLVDYEMAAWIIGLRNRIVHDNASGVPLWKQLAKVYHFCRVDGPLATIIFPIFLAAARKEFTFVHPVLDAPDNQDAAAALVADCRARATAIGKPLAVEKNERAPPSHHRRKSWVRCSPLPLPPPPFRAVLPVAQYLPMMQPALPGCWPFAAGPASSNWRGMARAW